MEDEKTMKKSEQKRNNIKNYIKRYWQLYALLICPILYFVIFKYGPMYGVIIAFKDFNIFAGIHDSPWIGMEIFKEVFASSEFYRALRNTFLLNLGDLVFSFPAPIILAILLNELISVKVRRITQTILYIPHFLSWVIIAGIMYQIFASKGVINLIINAFGGQSINFLGNNVNWVIVYLLTGIWQSAGYGTIIYLAALTGVNPALYDAAYVDGANRFQRIWHVTLPSIANTITILLVLQLGKIINISFERPYMLGNALVSEVAKVISTYVYQVGLEAGRFSFATAVGLFQSIVGLVMLITVNRIVKKMGQEGVM
ncbi:MAG: ABC transporter permease subunit [Firmicutes bacterium]|nr:ABC transporter permease subunit [Bacillota bacterium]